MSTRHANTAMRAMVIGLCVVTGLAACGGSSSSGTEATSPSTNEDQTTSTTVPGAVTELADGPLEPGRYRFVIENWCDDEMVDCAAVELPSPPIHVDVTVPAGWEAAAGYSLLHPESPIDVDASNGPTFGPAGAGLLLGWTNYWVGLNSDPCTPKGSAGEHQVPDIPVGPTVDDFVDAVVAHPTLDVTEPTEVMVGGHRARFFTLTAPSDLSACDRWRPWDPSIYAQGADNRWDVWTVDVDGFRVVVLAESFPDTPTEVQTQLREMVESIELAV